VVFGCHDEKKFTRLDLQSRSRCDWIVVSVFPPRFCGWGSKWKQRSRKCKQPCFFNQPSLSTAPNGTDASFTRGPL
jgi:hypothetical protein